MATVSQFISKARSYVGSGYKHFCDSMGLGLTDWCAAFVSVVAKECGMDTPWSASCTAQRDTWKGKGLWHSGVKGVKPGCIIYFDWDKTGDCDHVAIVTKVVSSDEIVIIDGNFAGGNSAGTKKVAERTITSSDPEYGIGKVAGYSTPELTGGVTYSASSASSGLKYDFSVLANAEPIEINLDDYVSTMKSEIETMMASYTKNMRFVEYTGKFFGSPFRFLDNTDPPINITEGDGEDQIEFNEGRTYVKNISLEAPLVHFIPGVPSYLKDMSKSNMQVFEEYVRGRIKNTENENLSNTVLEKIMGIEGRYFSFVPAFAEYRRYLNILCRTAAVYMGIGDRIVPGTAVKRPDREEEGITYANYDYSNWQDDGISSSASTLFGDLEDGQLNEQKATTRFEDFISGVDDTVKHIAKDIFGGTKSVKIYADSSSSFSESLSNNTSQSQIAGMFDTAESLSKELQFWAGGTSAGDVVGGVAQTLTDSVGALAEGVLKLVGLGSTQLTNLTDYASYIISGSNVIFPELWTDSSYSKSYSCSATFLSPYGDPESRFLYTIMPLMFILALALPRQTSANSFTSPMFVRVVSKGQYSCEMGIISGVSIEKGGDAAWSASGMPLSIKVNIDIKDLYTALSMPNTTQPGLFFSNDALIEFLSATCGIDMIEPNLKLKIDTFLNTVVHVATDIPRNIYENSVQKLNNIVMRFLGIY